MTFLTIILVFVLGFLLLFTGEIIGNILSIIPRVVAGWQFSLMFALG